MNELMEELKRTESVKKSATLDRSTWKSGALSLEQLLIDLTKYGKPRVSRLGSGWHATVEMYVSDKGVDFKISSEFGHGNPTAAVIECAARLDVALLSLGA